MLPAALTAERVRLPDGTSATRYPWNGEEVLVRDDALTIIRVIEVLTDEGKSDDQRRDEFLALFFVDWADAWCACDYDAAEFVRMRDAAVWDMCGLDLTGDRPHETPLWDLEEDAARIRTSFRQAYGIEWDEVRGRISFAEFVARRSARPSTTATRRPSRSQPNTTGRRSRPGTPPTRRSNSAKAAAHTALRKEATRRCAMCSPRSRERRGEHGRQRHHQSGARHR